LGKGNPNKTQAEKKNATKRFSVPHKKRKILQTWNNTAVLYMYHIPTLNHCQSTTLLLGIDQAAANINQQPSLDCRLPSGSMRPKEPEEQD
jgi:hypothetical protein